MADNERVWRNISINEATALLTVTALQHAPEFGIGTLLGKSPTTLSEAIRACERGRGLFLVTHNGNASIVAENGTYGSSTFLLDIGPKRPDPWA